MNPSDQELIPAMEESNAEKVEQILPLIAQLEQELQVENPEIESYLRKINHNLRELPDLVHLLTDDQIAPIYQAMLKKSNVVIEVKKSRAKGKKGLLDDGTSVADWL